MIVTMLTQKLLPGRAECPADHPFPSDRRNLPDQQLPSDHLLKPTERCGEPNPGRTDEELVNLATAVSYNKIPLLLLFIKLLVIIMVI